jgi:hypothetical protein
MKNNILFVLLITMCSCMSCEGQSTFGEKYLQLKKTIVLPNVTGRIDHMDVNLKEKILDCGRGRQQGQVVTIIF